MKSTAGCHQNPVNMVAHVSDALNGLHRLLADIDRQRDAVRDAIETLNNTFIPPAPIPQRPNRKEKPGPTGMLSRYPVHPKAGKRERMSDDDGDYDLSGLTIDFSGTSTWTARVRAVARVAHLAGKRLRVSAVADVILDQCGMDTSVKAAGHEVSRALRHHAEYERTGYGAYVYVPPDGVPPPSSSRRNL